MSVIGSYPVRSRLRLSSNLYYRTKIVGARADSDGTATSDDCCPRPGCPGSQPGRSSTNPTREPTRRGTKEKSPTTGGRIRGPDDRSAARGFLDAVQTTCGEKICLVPDEAPYFTAKAVQQFVEDTPIERCYRPRGFSEPNSAEKCWRQPDRGPGTRLFETPDDFRGAALSALDRIEGPAIFTYLCPYVSVIGVVPRSSPRQAVLGVREEGHSRPTYQIEEYIIRASLHYPDLPSEQ